VQFKLMSAFHPKADIPQQPVDVRFVPGAEARCGQACKTGSIRK